MRRDTWVRERRSRRTNPVNNEPDTEPRMFATYR